jgi:hypothetical protein
MSLVDDMSKSSLYEWVSANFEITDITPVSVSKFIGTGIDLSTWLTPLTVDELIWLLVYDIVEYKKYKDLNLSTSHKMFLAAARKEFENILKVIEIDFDLTEIWEKSGN